VPPEFCGLDAASGRADALVARRARRPDLRRRTVDAVVQQRLLLAFDAGAEHHEARGRRRARRAALPICGLQPLVVVPEVQYVKTAPSSQLSGMPLRLVSICVPAKISQASPIVSPSQSDWVGLAIATQLSLQSATPSASVSVSATPQPHCQARSSPGRSGSRRCSPPCRRRRCRRRRRRSRRPRRDLAGSFGQPSMQSAVPSPSLSCRARRSRTGRGSILSGSSGQPSMQSAVPSPSLSVSAHAAAAGARRDLERIVRAAVEAVERAVAVGVDVGNAAATDARRDLQRVVRAAVDAVGGAVTVGVDVGDAATTDARGDLRGIVGATVEAVVACRRRRCRRNPGP
jgi:hypothetical protein